MEPIFTVGHSTRTIDDFVTLLQSVAATTLVDVRRFPGSRRYPHFNSNALAGTLRRSGIAYVHEPAMGGRRKPLPDSPNTYWRNEQFRGFADHMNTAEFQVALDRTMTRARSERQVLMCSEAVPWRCHRQLIADALVARGYDVFDLYHDGRVEPHILNPAARPLPDGRLIYPAIAAD